MSNLKVKQVFLPVILAVVVSLYLSVSLVTRTRTETSMTTASATTVIDIFGVKIEKNPPESKLTDLAVATWSTYECGPSKFPWTFTATETMYFLQGKVKVNVEGFDGSFEIGAGDLVIFPEGMEVTWDVIEAVKKHYSLEKKLGNFM